MSNFYDSAAWKKARKLQLQRFPFCAMCLRNGKHKPATAVDHIVRIRDGGAKLDANNMQSLCWTHHSQKTMVDRGLSNKPVSGADAKGLPTDPNHPWNRRREVKS